MFVTLERTDTEKRLLSGLFYWLPTNIQKSNASINLHKNTHTLSASKKWRKKKWTQKCSVNNHLMRKIKNKEAATIKTIAQNFYYCCQYITNNKWSVHCYGCEGEGLKACSQVVSITSRHIIRKCEKTMCNISKSTKWIAIAINIIIAALAAAPLLWWLFFLQRLWFRVLCLIPINKLILYALFYFPNV